jgi:hypothetical protein
MSKSVLTILEGETGTMVESFVDDFDDPLELANNQSGPSVKIYDHEKSLIGSYIGVPEFQGDPGDWSVDITIPNIGLSEKQQFTAQWRFLCSDGTVYKSRQTFFVEPDEDIRDSDIIVLVGRDAKMQVVLPVECVPGHPTIAADITHRIPAKPAIQGDSIRISLFRNNQSLYGEGLYAFDPNSGVDVETHIGKTVLTMPATVGRAKLEPLLLLVDVLKPGMTVPRTLTYKVWPITPQVLIASSQLEDFINKARIQNVIPELDYTQADLIQYLYRGLSLFNSYQPHMSSFDGTNMQGTILDAWLQCSAYYALASQLQAEGMLAFDFSGQTVSLNIDRTPAIESALGRVESALDANVKPLKKLLAKAGALSGDGSAGGGFIDGSRSMGTLGLINAPTTRLPFAGNRGSWFRPLY